MSFNNIFNVLLFATALLLVPITASFLIDGWNWPLRAYVASWIVFASCGLGYTFIASRSKSTEYKIAVGLGALGVFLLIWVNLAVGIIGSEDNSANEMYLYVLFIGLLGITISRLKPKGMATTMFSVAVAQMLVPTIALLFWNTDVTVTGESFWGNAGVFGVFVLNAFYAMLWVASALLFQHATQKKNHN